MGAGRLGLAPRGSCDLCTRLTMKSGNNSCWVEGELVYLDAQVLSVTFPLINEHLLSIFSYTASPACLVWIDDFWPPRGSTHRQKYSAGDVQRFPFFLLFWGPPCYCGEEVERCVDFYPSETTLPPPVLWDSDRKCTVCLVLPLVKRPPVVCQPRSTKELQSSLYLCSSSLLPHQPVCVCVCGKQG